MSKYAPLAVFLERQKGGQVALTFTEIERVLHALLPNAASQTDWWDARASKTHPFHGTLANIGFRAELDEATETVLFTREESEQLLGSARRSA